MCNKCFNAKLSKVCWPCTSLSHLCTEIEQLFYQMLLVTFALPSFTRLNAEKSKEQHTHFFLNGEIYDFQFNPPSYILYWKSVQTCHDQKLTRSLYQTMTNGNCTARFAHPSFVCLFISLFVYSCIWWKITHGTLKRTVAKQEPATNTSRMWGDIRIRHCLTLVAIKTCPLVDVLDNCINILMRT